MTRDEIGDMIAALPEGLEPDELIYRLVNWAVDREREACAKLCDGWPDYNVQGLAEAIRARGDVHASDISQEPVDKTAKSKHEPDIDIYDVWVEKNT